MNINFYLKDKTATGETPIEFVVQYRFTEINDDGKKLYKKIKRSTGLKIKPKYWNEKTQTARTFENSQSINIRLSEITNFVNGVEKESLEKKEKLSLDILKEKIDSFFKGEKKRDDFNFISFVEFLINSKSNTSFKITLKQTLRVLMEFKHETKYRIDFDTINLDFYNAFTSYLNKREYAINTKGKYIKTVKYFMNESLKRKLHTNLDYKFSEFKAQSEKIENIYLNETEIEKLFNFDLSKNPRLENVKNLFLIGCYTGLRFSDFTQIIPANINNNILTIKTQKTGKTVKIPLRPQVISILNKYNGCTPRAVSNQKMNDYLKELCQLAGFVETVVKYKSKGNNTVKVTKYKYEMICTHTARRSFATNCYKAGIPAKQIMLITGHSTESEFFKYIQINETENAEMLLKNKYFM